MPATTLHRILALPTKLRAYTARVASWLAEVWQAWACGAGVAILGWALWALKPCDLTYRVIGMILQLAGVWIAVWALLGVREFFGLPTFGLVLRDWWKRRPGWRQHYTLTAGSANMTLGAATGNMRGAVTYSRSMPTEQWLRVLTDAVEGLQRSLGDIDEKHTAAVKAIERDVQDLSDKSATETAKVEEKLKSVQTGGVAWGLIGALLVALGTVLTAVPVELAYAFGNRTPTCVFP